MDHIEPAAFIGAALTDLIRGNLDRYGDEHLRHMLVQLDAYVAETDEVLTATVARQHALLGVAAAGLVYDAIASRVAARDALRGAGRTAE